MMRRRGFLAFLFGQAGCLLTRRPALARAAEYLWTHQAGDGGWHSHTYGLLRSGQSLTPFVLEALLRIPPAIYSLPTARLDRALAFIRQNTRADGALGLSDPDFEDYPNYATALAVSALCRAGRKSETRPMVAYLRGQQFTEQNGWRPYDMAYGAWGMGGDRRTPPNTGHVDLSMTRHVMEALRAADVPASDPALQCARVYVECCQNRETDGGFFFTTTEFDTNKAGHDGKRYRSYGTTTADGILALRAAGLPPEDPRIAAAHRWLADRHRGMAVPGFIGEAYDRWPTGLAYYYSSASAQAFRFLGVDATASLTEALQRTQRADGSWSNPENLVKEDDPLIATPFAVRALLAHPSRPVDS